ncbi:dirigent protein 22-like [Salvia miltiorrhiza]|uniref:dirigent protein 22-like n=1 Tax=Salvia miltiorrhiza TaxID=226208 RepID=UPI0025ACC962|nr:dirigent protein 22-like [Salvia miltiorrhiza]XP_057790757.1 dirigent protein 22-like [Salvia miltiorrhiza]
MASIKITLFALLFLAIFTYSKATLSPLKETEITLYYKISAGGPNATVIEVPGPSIGPLNFTRFGATFVSDTLITEEIEEFSAPVARGRRFFVIAALDGSQSLWVDSVVFINGKYKGSTLQLQGSYSFMELSEMAVVGGTGKFRRASGYATFETVYFDPVRSYAVLQSNLTVLHYV